MSSSQSVQWMAWSWPWRRTVHAAREAALPRRRRPFDGDLLPLPSFHLLQPPICVLRYKQSSLTNLVLRRCLHGWWSPRSVFISVPLSHLPFPYIARVFCPTFTARSDNTSTARSLPVSRPHVPASAYTATRLILSYCLLSTPCHD